MECLRRASWFAVILVWLCAVVLRGSGGQSASGSELEEKTPLYFSYITTQTGIFVTAGAIPAVDLALRLINDRTDILPNYTLGYTEILDSEVDRIKIMPIIRVYVTANFILFGYIHRQGRLMAPSRHKYQSHTQFPL